MKTNYLLLAMIFLGMLSCHSQDLKKNKELKEEIKPGEKVVVNRKYDENGNLVEFDSTYTSYYSSFEGDTLSMDSIMKDFNAYYDHYFSGMSSNPFMLTDSIFVPDFFHDDFFEQSFIRQDEELLRMMREMDSLKNEFFKMQLESSEKLKL